MRAASKLLLGAALAALAACSASTSTRAFYNNLDWLAAWKVRDYVDFDREQRKLFEHEFDTLWLWHRSSELPRYAQEFRALAAEPLPVTAARIEAVTARFAELGQRTVTQAVGHAAPLYRTLSDEQAAEFVEELAEDLEDEREKVADKDRAERDRNDAKKMREQLQRWLGRLTDAQKERVAQWAAARHDTSALWLENRARWNQRFAALLASRAAAGFEQRLAEQFLEGRKHWTAELSGQVAANRAHWQSMLFDVLALLTPEQEPHLRGKLLEMAQDLEALAAQPQD